MRFRVGVMPHGQRMDSAIWFWRKDVDPQGLIRISWSLTPPEKETFKEAAGLAMEHWVPKVKPLPDGAEDISEGNYLYVQRLDDQEEDWSQLAGLVVCRAANELNDETFLAINSGLIEHIEFDWSVEDYLVKAKAEEKKVFEISESVAVEMTLASETFKATLDKEGGEIRLQKRDQQTAPIFSIPRAKIDELVDLLVKIRDVHGPRVDSYGE